MSPIAMFHAAGGITLLVLGAVALTAPKRRLGRHRLVGEVYFWVLVATLGSGAVIGAQRPGISVFEIVTPPTLAFGVLGYFTAKRRRRLMGLPWFAPHIVGQGGSYIGVVTAFSFQVAPSFMDLTTTTIIVLFALPTFVGTALILRTLYRWTGFGIAPPVRAPEDMPPVPTR